MSVKCMYGNAPEVDCYARACPVHGTASADPYGPRQGARLSEGQRAEFAAAGRPLASREEIAAMKARLRELRAAGRKGGQR